MHRALPRLAAVAPLLLAACNMDFERQSQVKRARRGRARSPRSCPPRCHRPGRPRRWRGTLPGSLEGAAFAEIIPFQETRDYVQNVIANATVYAALLSGRPQSLKDWLGRVEPGQ